MSCGHQRLVAGGLAATRRPTCTSFSIAWRARFLGRLEQRADVDVEAEVGERGGDHLGAAVVAVLAHLGDQHARPAALARRRTPAISPASCVATPRRRRRRAPYTPEIAADRRRGGGPNTFSSASEISPTVARGARRLDARASSRLPSPLARPRVSASSAACTRAVVARRRASARAARSAARAPRCCRSRGCRSRPRSVEPVLVDADDHVLAAVDARPAARAAASSMRSLGMPDSTALVMPPSASTSSMSAHACVGQSLRSAPRRSSCRPAGRRRAVMPRLLLAGSAGCCARCARENSVGSAIASSNAVGVQALRAAEHRGHRLDGRCARRCCTGPAR